LPGLTWETALVAHTQIPPKTSRCQGTMRTSFYTWGNYCRQSGGVTTVVLDQAHSAAGAELCAWPQLFHKTSRSFAKGS